MKPPGGPPKGPPRPNPEPRPPGGGPLICGGAAAAIPLPGAIICGEGPPIPRTGPCKDK